MTFSTTARCEKTGMLGIAVCTAVPCVGSTVNYIKPNIGAIAIQALCEPDVGFAGLELLSQGIVAEEVKQRLIERDVIEKVQFCIVDARGNSAAFTGQEARDVKFHLIGNHYATAGNILVDRTTIEKMAEAFEKNFEIEFPERLLRALEAGNATPGDSRGRQSASLEIFYKDKFPYRSIRVDEHRAPVEELRRIFELGKKQIFPSIGLMSKFSEIRDPIFKGHGNLPSIRLLPVSER